MQTQFTTKSQEALSAAAMNASTAGNPQIEPAHLLKALMDQRDREDPGHPPPGGLGGDHQRHAGQDVMPTAVASWSVRWVSTSQSCAVACIHVPVFETSAPPNHSR